MKVLYLTINPNRVSTTVPTAGWFRFLRPKGLEPVLVSHEIGEFHAWAVEQQIPAYHVALPHPNKINPLPFAKSLWQLRRIVRQHRVELIHCNEQDCYPIGAYLAQLAGLPIVVSVHFTMLRGFCEWAFGVPRSPNRMFFVSRRSMEACSPALASVVPADRWRVLHNGIDLDYHSKSAEMRHEFRHAHHLEDCTVIGVACALRPRKQIEHLIDAAVMIDRPNLRVLVAGGPVPGDEEYARQLLDTCQQKLGERFVYLGHLADVRPFCAALDLFVNTSKEESFGIAVLEAMANNCPVVGYDSKAVDEVVLPDGGEITPQDDVQQLAATLMRWLTDPDRLASARMMARKQAERFEIRGLSEQLWLNYQETMSEKSELNPAEAMSNSFSLTSAPHGDA